MRDGIWEPIARRKQKGERLKGQSKFARIEVLVIWHASSVILHCSRPRLLDLGNRLTTTTQIWQWGIDRIEGSIKLRDYLFWIIGPLLCHPLQRRRNDDQKESFQRLRMRIMKNLFEWPITIVPCRESEVQSIPLSYPLLSSESYPLHLSLYSILSFWWLLTSTT